MKRVLAVSTLAAVAASGALLLEPALKSSTPSAASATPSPTSLGTTQALPAADTVVTPLVADSSTPAADLIAADADLAGSITSMPIQGTTKAKPDAVVSMSVTAATPAISAAVVDRPLVTTHFSAPTGITSDGNGNLYVTDSSRHTVRKITTGLVVNTLAGSSGASGSVDGTGTNARFNTPKGIAYNGGNLYVADSGNAKIRKVTTAGGVVTTLASAAGDGITVDASGNAYVTDSSAKTVRRVSSSGDVSTYAGATSGNSGSGKIETYVVNGDIDPIDPIYRTYTAPGKGDQSAGFAPVAITSGVYGVRLALTDTTPMSIAYTTADYPSTDWWSHALPYTATYGTSWVIPIFAFHSGNLPTGNHNSDAASDSQMWGFGGLYWAKTGDNTVRVYFGGSNPEVGNIDRIITLTFTNANSGTATTQVGVYPTNIEITPGHGCPVMSS